MISFLCRLIRDDFDEFVKEYLHFETDPGTKRADLWSPRGMTYMLHNAAGIYLVVWPNRIWVNNVEVSWLDRWRIRRAIADARAKKILDYMTTRPHPDLPALTAPRA